MMKAIFFFNASFLVLLERNVYEVMSELLRSQKDKLLFGFVRFYVWFAEKPGTSSRK